MSTIVIVGGHGKVALLTSRELAAGGHEVHSPIRNPDQVADVEATSAKAIVLDIEKASAADLDWVIIRPGRLNNDDATRRVAAGDGISDGTTSRSNVAALLANLATNPGAERRVLNVVDGDTDLTTVLEQL